MSEENVDLFVKGIEASTAMTYRAFFGSWIPRSTSSTDSLHLQGDFIGLDGVRGWFAELEEYFEDGHIHCPDVRDLGDWVLGLGTLRATGKDSGVETEQ